MMKKILMMAVAAALMCGCEKAIAPENESVNESERGGVDSPVKRFTFTVKGDFGAAAFSGGDDLATESQGTRAASRAAGYLSADGQDMTDLWVFDYVDGQCVQSVHQTATDSDWGTPQMSLAYGSHHVYFVASRGDTPVLNSDEQTISWVIPRDTFWKDYEVDVVSTSNGNRAVTLDRVATRLRLTVTDEVPDGVAQITVTPSVWYYGLNYTTGDAVDMRTAERAVTIPASYIGTSGILTMSFFGLSAATEWTTDVMVRVNDGDGNTTGQVVISDVPMKRNRSTDYSGALFNNSTTLGVGLSTDWLTAHVGAW